MLFCYTGKSNHLYEMLKSFDKTLVLHFNSNWLWSQVSEKKGLSLNTRRGYLSTRLHDKKIILCPIFFDLKLSVGLQWGSFSENSRIIRTIWWAINLLLFLSNLVIHCFILQLFFKFISTNCVILNFKKTCFKRVSNLGECIVSNIQRVF